MSYTLRYQLDGATEWVNKAGGYTRVEYGDWEAPADAATYATVEDAEKALAAHVDAGRLQVHNLNPVAPGVSAPDPTLSARVDALEAASTANVVRVDALEAASAPVIAAHAATEAAKAQ